MNITNPASLYYRLNPVHLDTLLSAQPSFPFTIGMLLNELRTAVSWLELSYDSIAKLKDFLSLSDYSPCTIDSLFTKNW